MSDSNTTNDASKYLLKNGVFLAKCNNNHGLTTFGKEGGKPKYFIEYELLEGDDKGKRIQSILQVEGNGTDYTRKVLKICGWDEASGIKPHHAKLDKVVRLTLRDETYNGKTTTRVQWVNEEHDTRVSKLAETKLGDKDADAVMGGLMAAWKGSGGANGAATSYPSPGNSASQDVDTSDIPF